MCELHFITKNQIRKAKETKKIYDVKISLSKTKNVGMCITFKNNSYSAFAPDRRIVYAISGSRLYFSSADENEGWKLQTSGKEIPGTLYLNLPRSHEEATQWASQYPGKYQLLYDEKTKYFCIDANGAAS